MMEKADIADYFRDLFYLEEEILAQAKKQGLPKEIRERYFDQTIKKQVVLAKILDLILHPNLS